MIIRHASLILTLLIGGLAVGCVGFSDRPTGNQMMLVRESPGTLGYQKLMAKTRESGDLKIFLEQKGLPDFLAEAESSDRQYLIFYYLDKHQAFACRTRGKDRADVEFAGPYPMTNGEWKLLNGVKTQMGAGPSRRD